MATPNPAGIEKAKQIRGWLSAEQQQKYISDPKFKGIDFSKYGLTIKPAVMPQNSTPPPAPAPSPAPAPAPSNTAPATPPTKVENVTPQTTTAPAKVEKAKVEPNKITTTSMTPQVSSSQQVAQTKAMLSKYKSVEELKASPWFATLSPDFQRKALAMFKPADIKAEDTINKWGTGKVDANKDDSEKRLAEITTNLNWYTQTDPQIFKTIDTYHDFLDYDNRSDKQKTTIDNFWLAKGRQASFNQMSASDLADWVVNGKFSEADLDYMKNNDPVKYWQYEQAKQTAQNNLTAKIAVQSFNSLFWDTDKNWTPDYIDVMNKNTEASLTAMKEYNATKNSPEMLQATVDMKNLQTAIETAQVEQQDIKKKIVEQYGSLPKTLLNSMIADATSDLQSDITKKTIEYNNKLGIFNSKLAVAKDEYDMKTARIKADTEKAQNMLSTFTTMLSSASALWTLWNANAVKPIVENMWTTKSPDWRQYNPKTWNWDKIEWVWWWWNGWWNWYSWLRTSDYKWDAMETSTNNLYWWTYAERRLASVWWKFVSSAIADKMSELNYLRNNMTLSDFLDLKKHWATFWAMAIAERDMIKAAASKLDLNMSDSAWNREINNIRTWILNLKALREDANWNVYKEWEAPAWNKPKTKKQLTLDKLRQETWAEPKEEEKENVFLWLPVWWIFRWIFN